MDQRMTALLLICAVLVSSASGEEEGVIAPWLPVKDALVTVPASSGHPSSTFLHFLPSEVGHGRRLPAIFLVKKPREEEVVAYLTGIYGDLGEELLSAINSGDKLVREYLTDHMSPKPPPVLKKSSGSPRPPPPFDSLLLTSVVLPAPYISVSDLAMFPTSRFATPTKTVSFMLVAERSDIFP